MAVPVRRSVPERALVGGTPTRLCQAPTPSGPLLRMKSGTGGEAERVPSSHADRKTSIPHSVPVVRGRRGGAVERARRRRRSRDARGDRRARDECRGKRKTKVETGSANLTSRCRA